MKNIVTKNPSRLPYKISQAIPSWNWEKMRLVLVFRRYILNREYAEVCSTQRKFKHSIVFLYVRLFWNFFVQRSNHLGWWCWQSRQNQSTIHCCCVNEWSIEFSFSALDNQSAFFTYNIVSVSAGGGGKGGRTYRPFIAAASYTGRATRLV